MKKIVKYTKPMYQYLAWRLFREIYGAMEWVKEEANEIDSFVKEAGSVLSDDEIKLVDNRARRMKNEYGEQKLEELREQHWDELGDDDEDYDYGNDDFIRFNVDYNEKFYEIWKLDWTNLL